MKQTRIIFVGSQNLGGMQDDGETMKNYMLAKGFESLTCKVIRIDMRHRPKRYYYMVKYVWNLLFYRKSKIVMSASSLVAYKLFKIARMLLWSPQQQYYWVIGGTFGKLITEKTVQKDLYINMRQIVVEGQSMKDQLDAAGFNNVIVLPNIKEITYVPVKDYSNSPIKRFVFLSRVMPEKGVDYIVEASKQLCGEGITDFIVDLYGSISQDYKKYLAETTEGVSNVKYKGFLMLNGNAGYDTLATYDMMLFPTYWHGEGFPGILIDAFVSGLPVIATDWNLNTSLIMDGENGLIIPPHDSKALAEAMKQVINGEVDVRKMGRRAQGKCMNYDLNHVINKELLKELDIIEL